MILIAILGDGDAADQFHDEIGPACGGFPAVKDTGDVGMIHQGQGLALGLKAGHDLARVHAGLDDLESNFSPNGLLLLGHEDDAEAAFAYLLQELVRANHGTRGFRAWRIDGRTAGDRRCFQEAPLLFVDTKQLQNPLQGRRILVARLLQIGHALLRCGDLPCTIEDFFFVDWPVEHGSLAMRREVALLISA